MSRDHPGMQEAAFATFGSRAVVLKNAKILFAELGSQPQIPHADDHCNRELFGVCHLLGDQAQTEAVAYSAAAAYPTGIQVQWDEC